MSAEDNVPSWEELNMSEQADNRPYGNSHVLACNSISAFRVLSRTSTAELAARGRWPVLTSPAAHVDGKGLWPFPLVVRHCVCTK